MSAAEKIDTDLEAFRAEAKAWLEANFPPSLKGKSGMMMGEDGPADGNDYGKWKKAMGEKGWGTPTYPKQYGGGGLSGTVVSCVAARVSSAQFAAPEGGGATIVIPVTFVSQ